MKKLTYLIVAIMLPMIATAQTPLLRLTTPHPIPASPCSSCEPKDKIVRYNFSNNVLSTVWAPEDTLRERFWRRLPRVGHEFTFQVENVNPFRFDVTISDEQINNNTDIPDFLISAFTPGGIVRVDSVASVPLEDALLNLGSELNIKFNEFRSAGDCFNPCDYITPMNNQILEHFRTHFGYLETTSSLETFFTTSLNLSRIPRDSIEEMRISKLNAIVELYTKFRSIGSATISYHIPQVQNVDQYIFKLNITPQKGISTGSRVVNQDIVVDVLGGLKADVSSGLFFTRLVDHNYSLLADSTTLTDINGADSVVNRRNKVIQEKGSKMDFGVDALFHFYPRISKGINLGLSLGAGMTLNEKPKLRYLGGVSLLVGRTNRIALTYGWAMGYVERLSNRYDDQKLPSGDIYTAPNESSVQIKKIFSTQNFFSVTYNIPLARNRSVVSPSNSGEDKKEEKKD